MDTVSMLNKMSFYCQPILPLVYDESMSYYETLCKVVGQLNTTGETVNKLNEGLTGEIADRQTADAALDARIKEIEKVSKKIHFLVFAGTPPHSAGIIGTAPTRSELRQWVNNNDLIITLLHTTDGERKSVYAASCTYNAGNWSDESSDDFNILVPIHTSYDADNDHAISQKVAKITIPPASASSLDEEWGLQVIEINTPSTSSDGVVNFAANIFEDGHMECNLTPNEFAQLYAPTWANRNLCVAVNAKLFYDGYTRTSSIATINSTNHLIRIAFERDYETYLDNGVNQLNKTTDYIIGNVSTNTWTHESIDSKVFDFPRYIGFQFTRGAHNVITTDDESTPNAVYTQYHANSSGKLYQNLPTRLIDTVDNVEYWNGVFDIKDGNHMTFTFVASNYATASDKMLVRIIELSANVNTTTWKYAEKEFTIPLSDSDTLYVDFWPVSTEETYNEELKAYVVELASNQTFDTIFDSINAGHKTVARLYQNEDKSGFPDSSVGVNISGNKTLGTINFHFLSVDASNIAGFAFIGEVITLIKTSSSTLIFISLGANALPVPNGDGTDDGKVPRINGKKWELQTVGGTEDYLVAITPLSPSAVPTSVDGGIAQFAAACDKTFAEIKGAIDAGKNVLGNYSGNIWPLSRATDTIIAFDGKVNLGYFGDASTATCTFVIQSNGIATITCAAGELPAVSNKVFNKVLVANNGHWDLTDTLPSPNSDGSDNGKVAAVDGTKWALKKPVVDDALSDTSTNPVQNKVVKEALDGKANNTEATEQAAGLMSAKDKKKLNGIEDGANKTIVDEMLSDGSTNPVQNKAITAALASVAREFMYPIAVTATSTEWVVNNGIAYKEASANRTFDNIKAAYYSNNKIPVCVFDRMTYNMVSSSSTAFVFASYRGAAANDSQYAGLGKYPTSLITINTTGVVISRTAGDLPAVDGTDNDKMLIVSGGEWALQRVAGATVDAELSTTSENPVQNKTVTDALNGKLPKTGGTVTGALRTNDSFSAGGTISFGEAPIVLSQTDDGAAKILYGSADVNDNPPPLSRLKVARPTADDDAATKKYVDGRNEYPQFKGFVTLTPANAPLGTGVGLSPIGSGNDFTLDISDVNENTPTLLTGVKTPTDADTNAAATVAYVKSKAASSSIDFVINGTMASDGTVTLDKTFSQIKEALSAGKRPTVRVATGRNPLYLYYSDALLSTPEEEYIVFIGAIDTYSVIKLLAFADGSTNAFRTRLVELVNDTLPQQTMLSEPTENMQIATKKYVDDKAKKAVVIDVSEEEVRSYNYSDIDSEITNGGANVWLSLGTNQMRMVAYYKTGASSYELTFVNFVTNTFNIHTITVSPSAASYAYITK